MSKDASRPPHRPSSRKPGWQKKFSRTGHGKDQHQRPDRRGDDDRREDEGPLRLFGLHAIEAALKNPARKVKRLVLTENAERRLADAVGELKHPVERASPRDLDRILGADTVHQGAMLETEPLPEPEFADLIAEARGRPLIVLDQVTDPHNAGAILRSAAVFGASGVVMTRRHSPPLNGTLAKSASGALELVPVALVQNLARAMAELKEAGVTLIGLDGEGDALLDDQPLAGATAFVLGAEGKGLRQLTRETCDKVCRIGTSGALASLNVSNAAAISLHLAFMRRRQAASI